MAGAFPQPPIAPPPASGSSRRRSAQAEQRHRTWCYHCPGSTWSRPISSWTSRSARRIAGARGRGDDLCPRPRRGHPAASTVRSSPSCWRPRGRFRRRRPWRACRRMLDVPVRRTSSRRCSCSPRRSRAGAEPSEDVDPARPAPAGGDRAGAGQLGPDREHRLPGGDLRRGEPGLPDERRRARDGRPHRPERGRQLLRRPVRAAPDDLILAGDFPDDPLPLVERCFVAGQNPGQQAVVTQVRHRRPVG